MGTGIDFSFSTVLQLAIPACISVQERRPLTVFLSQVSPQWVPPTSILQVNKVLPRFGCRRAVLEINRSTGLGDLGNVKWSIALCLMAVFVMVYFSLWKGIKSSGKVRSCLFSSRRRMKVKIVLRQKHVWLAAGFIAVCFFFQAVWITATLPYIVLIILLIRGVTLPGSQYGIIYYLTPRWEKLAEPSVSGTVHEIALSASPPEGFTPADLGGWCQTAIVFQKNITLRQVSLSQNESNPEQSEIQAFNCEVAKRLPCEMLTWVLVAEVLEMNPCNQEALSYSQYHFELVFGRTFLNPSKSLFVPFRRRKNAEWQR